VAKQLGDLGQGSPPVLQFGGHRVPEAVGPVGRQPGAHACGPYQPPDGLAGQGSSWGAGADEDPRSAQLGRAWRK
jgi:hypothetical protein